MRVLVYGMGLVWVFAVAACDSGRGIHAGGTEGGPCLEDGTCYEGSTCNPDFLCEDLGYCEAMEVAFEIRPFVFDDLPVEPSLKHPSGEP